MAWKGPLGSSDLLPVALVALFVVGAILAAGVLLGNRPAMALGIFSGLAGFPVALGGAVLGLTMPWPLFLAGYNAALAVVGITVWELPSRPDRF